MRKHQSYVKKLSHKLAAIVLDATIWCNKVYKAGMFEFTSSASSELFQIISNVSNQIEPTRLENIQTFSYYFLNLFSSLLIEHFKSNYAN